MKVWLKVAVSLGVLGALLALLPWGDVREAVGRLSFGVWALVLAGFLGGHALGIAKWRMLVGAGRAGFRRLDAARCYAAGLFANLCLPSIVGGDVLRAALAAKATGRAEAVVLGGIADRVLDTAALGLLLLAGGVLARASLPGWGAQLVGVAVALALVAGLGALPFAYRRPLARWPRRLRRPVGRTLVALRRLVRAPLVAPTAFLFSLMIQGGFVLLNALIGRAIGIDIALAVWFLAWPLAKLAGLLPISLGGLGVRDAAFAALLVPLGVPMAQGVVAALVWQSVLVAGGLVGGLLWYGLGRRGAQPGPLAAVRSASRPVPSGGRA